MLKVPSALDLAVFYWSLRNDDVLPEKMPSSFRGEVVFRLMKSLGKFVYSIFWLDTCHSACGTLFRWRASGVELGMDTLVWGIEKRHVGFDFICFCLLPSLICGIWLPHILWGWWMRMALVFRNFLVLAHNISKMKLYHGRSIYGFKMVRHFIFVGLMEKSITNWRWGDHCTLMSGH